MSGPGPGPGPGARQADEEALYSHAWGYPAPPRAQPSPAYPEPPPLVPSAPSAAPSSCRNYAIVNAGGGQLVKVYYDEAGRPQFAVPLDAQYELFDRQPPHPPPRHPGPFSDIFSPDFPGSQDRPEYARATDVGFSARQEVDLGPPTSNFLKDVLGNWEPNATGTYSPFGQHYPLTHPSSTQDSRTSSNATDEAKLVSNRKNVGPAPRRTDGPLADTSTKKRIVAEVKPMRPSYSDVLAKNAKNPPNPDMMTKSKPLNGHDAKNINIKTNGMKTDKPLGNIKVPEEPKQKIENPKTNAQCPVSSGSDSGDVNTDEYDKHQKPVKRNKNKHVKMTRKWSSLYDVTDQDKSFTEDSGYSQFVFIQNPSEKTPKRGKKEKKSADKSVDTEEEISLENSEDYSQFVFQESPAEGTKIKKKKEKNYNSAKLTKTADKKKVAVKNNSKKGKPSGYVGVVQGYLERWTNASWKAVVWFCYLLSDICHMSAHLSFDLLTSVFTQSYVSSQAVWRSGKERLSNLRESKYLLYIDKKLGDTPLGFWRRIKWFKKAKEEQEPCDASKANVNIPLPSTGEEAMKRLLACKGKDPYSILGVNVKCTDEDIKRYYRRQAFLVHPDKNQQPGAEEAFKILQHAFDLIGELERRESFDRRTAESQHVEAAWSELSTLLAQLHDKMEVAANTIRCTNCGRRHKRVITDRPCYAARYCAQCKIRHSAKEGDIWAESGMWGLLVMYYACMDGAVYQITQWASCQKKNLKQLKPNCHVVQYRIVLGNKAAAAPNLNQRSSSGSHDPNLEEFLNNLYNKSGAAPGAASPPPRPAAPGDPADAKLKRRNKKTKT